MQVNTEVENTRKKRRFAPKIRALALLVFALCWAVVLCLGLLFAILQDRSLPLPQKLQMQLADQINAKIAPREMRFEAAEFALV
ncbi:MAG: hypothetical protein ACPGRD_11985, partial [Planktomarina sp.]